jgi:hypothetical protein
MAQLAVAGGGAAVGAIAGSIIPGVGTVLGAQIGWAVGGIAGALLFPPKGQDTSGPRLGDLSVQTSGYGVPIPVVAARAKLAGNVIWMTDIEERRTTRRQGKGGGGAKTTEYSYFLSWGVGLCEWLIPPNGAGVLRIWLDNNLVYDTTGDSEVVAIPGLTWRFYEGSETQFPDPLIEATVGSTNAPAHRGLAYIVFEDVPLDRFGNRMPQVTVELASEITRTFPEVVGIAPASPLWPSQPSTKHYNGILTSNVAVDYARGRIYEGRTRTSGTVGTPADEMIRVYDLVTMETVGEYQYDRVVAPLLGLGAVASNNGLACALLHVGVDGFLYAAGGDSTHVPIVKINPDRMAAVDFFGTSLAGAGTTFGGSSGAYLTVPIQLASFQVPRLGGVPRTFLAGVGNLGGCTIIDADFMEYVWGDTSIAIDPVPFAGVGALSNEHWIKLVPGAVTTSGTDVWVISASLTAVAPEIFISKMRVASGAADLGLGAAMGLRRFDYTAIDVVAEVDASATRAYVLGAFFDPGDETLVITIAGSGIRGSYGRISTFKWASGGPVVWALVNHAGGTFDDARGDAGRLLSGIWGRGGDLVLQPGTGDPVVNAVGAGWAHTLSWLDEQQGVVGWTGTRVLTKRFLTRAAPTNLTVSDVVQALCERAGLLVSDIDTSALSDALRGYTLARPMSARDAMTPLLAFTNCDAVEQDDVLLFRKRGGATVAAIPYTDLVRENPDASVIEEQRAQDVDLPREVTVRFADIERGWEQNAQSWRRPLNPTATMTSRGAAAIDLPMPITVSEGKTVARRQCIAVWRERTRLSFGVGPKFARLVPTDPITVATRDGATIRCRVLAVQLGANWSTRIEAVTEDAAVYGLTAVGDGGSDWNEPQMPSPYYARLDLPNLALAEDGDDLAQAGLREYAFVCAYDGTRFRGIRVVRSPDASAWEDIDVVTTPCTWGSVVSTPPAPPSPWTWDEVNSIRVSLSDGDLDSATEGEVLNGANRAALISNTGAAEIIQFRTATLESDGTYTLTGLLRGRRGTEDQILARRAGDGFILLDAARLPFSDALGSAAAPRFYRGITVYETVETARSTTTKSQRGRAEQPYAPCQITVSRDGPLNITLSWVRRTRVGGELLNGTGVVPLSEATEAYEVDIVNGPVPVGRTYSGNYTGGGATLFDDDPATFALILIASLPGLVEVEFAEPQLIGGYGMRANDSGESPTAWRFQIWDGAAWVTVDTRTSAAWTTGEVRAFTLSAAVTVSRVRLSVDASGTGTFGSLRTVSVFSALGSNDIASPSYAQTIARTISGLTTPTAVYSAANQTTDFGAARPFVLARIYQISGIVGRGIPAELIA